MLKNRLVLLLVPVLYIPLCVFVPIKLLNTNYGYSVILLFWIPSALLYAYLYSWMGTGFRRAFWITFSLLIPVTFGFEYVCLALDVWSFSEQTHKLWGPELWGAPVEEFVFWFGATPLCVLLYLYYYRVAKGEPHA